MNSIRKNTLNFPTLMNEILKPDWFGGMENNLNNVPAVNIKENETNFELELVAPGRNKSDFTIEIDVDILTISIETKVETEEGQNRYSRKEFNLSSFKRAFSLPKTIDADKIEADYKDGLLRFVLPKKEEALPKPKRMIELS